MAEIEPLKGETVKVMEGNHAASYGALLSRVEVISAYPITPQSQVVELLSELVGSGQLKAKFIKVESEHSAMSSLVGASATGARCFTATSSHGLALMHEILHWIAGARMPIVLVNINRAMGPPWTIYCDHNDAIAQRDVGLMQYFAENSQEILDSIIQAFKISESVMMPTMINIDAFFLSHTTEPVIIPDQKKVDKFLPPFEPTWKLDPSFPQCYGGLSGPNIYYELRYKMHKAQDKALDLITKVGKEYGDKFGRYYDLVETYKCRGADVILVAYGTIASTARIAIDQMRAKGKKVGMLKMRVLRPFPKERIRKIFSKVKKVAVFDRNISYGMGGAFAQEIKAAIYDLKEKDRPVIFPYVGGIGGRDVTPEILIKILNDTIKYKAPKEDIIWVDVKRGKGKREYSNATIKSFYK